MYLCYSSFCKNCWDLTQSLKNVNVQSFELINLDHPHMREAANFIIQVPCLIYEDYKISYDIEFIKSKLMNKIPQIKINNVNEENKTNLNDLNGTILFEGLKNQSIEEKAKELENQFNNRGNLSTNEKSKEEIAKELSKQFGLSIETKK